MHGQKKELKISTTDSISILLLKDIHYQKLHFSETSLLKTLDSVKLKVEELGFLNYRLDSLVKNSSLTSTKDRNDLATPGIIYIAHFNLGIQIKKIKIYYDNNDIGPDQLSGISGMNSSMYFETRPKSLSNKLKSISKLLEKNGNSFSEIALKNIIIKNDSLVEASLFIKKSTLRKIDKIIIEGYSNFPKSFLKHNLKLERNTIFSKKKLDESSNSINALPFVSEIKSPEVLFTKDSTIVYLYLKKENASRFDGLIGFTSKENGKGLSLNGYLDLSIGNLFNSGENLNLVWKNNGNNRQVFNLDVSLPYIFNSKISPNLALNIYKQDSSFVNSTFKVVLPYKISKRNSVGITIQSESSSNLLTNTSSIVEDYKTIFYGLSYRYQIPYQHTLFKTKFNFFTEVLVGKRKSNITNNQSKFFLKSNFLWTLNLKNHIFLQNQSSILNSESYLNNELLRIGGTNSIRAFDEESILATTYSVFNIEYRYSTNNNSYIYSITDLGYLRNNNLSSRLYTFGIGYAFTSKLGFINLSYAFGKSSNAPFNFNNSRFHLKIVNYF